jgi:hypothetical protein
LREKLIPKLEGAKHVNGGKSGGEVFLESVDGAFGCINPMVVRGDKLDVDQFELNVLLDLGGMLVVHHVQCQIAWLGIPIFGSDFWDPHWKQNSDSVFDSKDSGWIIFEFCC